VDTDTSGISDDIAVELTSTGEDAPLVDNTSDPDDLPFGNKPGEVKGPDYEG